MAAQAVAIDVAVIRGEDGEAAVTAQSAADDLLAEQRDAPRVLGRAVTDEGVGLTVARSEIRRVRAEEDVAAVCAQPAIP